MKKHTAKKQVRKPKGAPKNRRTDTLLGGTKKSSRPPQDRIPRQSAPVKARQAVAVQSADAEPVRNRGFCTKPRLALQPSKTASDDILSREHWAAYCSPSTISQETGLPARLMLRSVAKELCDNALDWADQHGVPGEVTASLQGTHTITVTNGGPGWHATLQELAIIYSLARGSRSSKWWRQLGRGAAGRGLQEIVGVVASGGGRIIIRTRNQRIVLRPQIGDGLTTIEEVTKVKYPDGTSITVEVDPAYPADPDALNWAQTAIHLARHSRPAYTGRSCVRWFDTDSFHGLLQAVSPEMVLHDFLSRFQGCSARDIRQEVSRRFGLSNSCRGLTRDAASELLSLLQSRTQPVNARRLGLMGRDAWPLYSDGYAVNLAVYEVGAREPLAEIPFVMECWARSVSEGQAGHPDLDVDVNAVTVNRTLAVGHYSCQRIRGREVVLNLNGRRINLSLPRISAQFTLNITAPFIPILSTGKLPDFSSFETGIQKTVEQAVARAHRATRQPRDSRKDGQDDVSHQPGKLHRIIQDAATSENCKVIELTVLSKDKDPYALDTAAGHRAGRWCAHLIERFLAPNARIHLRGLHYLLASAGEMRRPDGKVYINDNQTWEWLSNVAAKAARWLNYVDFNRIVDERNAPPELYLPPYYQIEPECSRGEEIIIPDADKALPGFTSPPWPVVQPFRNILIGEKVSLRPVLLPITQLVGGELLLPTGEPSDTMIAELAARCAQDPRPSVVLYFSDFDPAGHQMPVSVSRKLQALRDLLYPHLNIQVHQVALTLNQVRDFGLPSTPLKPTERRADRWREILGHEQTEIDALAALQPHTLDRIARDAIKPFYDPALAERVQEAERNWQTKSKELLFAQPAYQQARLSIELSLELLHQSAESFSNLQAETAAVLDRIEAPPIKLPQANIESDASAPKPLFDSRDDFVTASHRLRQHKQLTLDTAT